MNRARLDALLAATWPPASSRALGPWTLRDGGGGGKRVAAASTDQPVTEDDIDRAERAMDDAGQQALFAVSHDQNDLDRRLADRTYLMLDPTLFYGIAIADLPKPDEDAAALWPADDAQRAIWAAGGVGPARLAIMQRVTVPKTTLRLTRDGRVTSTAFVALDRDTAVLHALETDGRARRQGAGRALMLNAGLWGAEQGATRLGLLVTRANVAANALYRDLGMAGQPCYHYRIRP